jgi:hypothetical protein
MLAISVPAAVFVRAVSHALDTRHNAAIFRKLRPLPSEAARTILTAKGQVKIVSLWTIALNYLALF